MVYFNESNSIECDSDVPFASHDSKESAACDIQVPPPVLDTDLANAFDEAGEEYDDFIALGELDENLTDTVPTPQVVELLQAPHWFAEYFSPPRIAPVVHRRGRNALLSLDLQTGWNFHDASNRQTGLDALTRLAILWLGLSPPCTVFSDLQRLFNIKRIDPAVWQSRWVAGVRLVLFAMACARRQIDEGRYFFFEHPARATSWKLDEVQAIAQVESVHVIEFDMCRFGLRSKVGDVPMRKRTKIMTNSKSLANLLSNRFCDGCQVHQCIMGNEGGMSRAVWAQHYPAGLVDAIARVVCS